jgi:hypothetical protein
VELLVTVFTERDLTAQWLPYRVMFVQWCVLRCVVELLVTVFTERDLRAQWLPCTVALP